MRVFHWYSMMLTVVLVASPLRAQYEGYEVVDEVVSDTAVPGQVPHVGDEGYIEGSAVPESGAGEYYEPLSGNGCDYGAEGYASGWDQGYGDCGDGTCGQYGCGTCAGHHRPLHALLGCLGNLHYMCEDCFAECGPYGDGTCAVHWFDVHAEFLYLTRDRVSRQVDFASDGIAGPIVLSTDNLSFDEEPGFRLTGTYQVGASSHLEATYFGTLFWRTSAEATSDSDNLYSALSDFGTLPAGGFLQSDQAALQRIEYDSSLDNVELNWRSHWMGKHYFLQGSFLMGARYVRLEEELRYRTRVNAHIDPITTLPRGPASMDYLVAVDNDLIGFQLGSDLHACLLPGLLAGAELKAGVYANVADQATVVAATNLDPAVREAVADEDVALVAEANLTVVYQIKPWLALRGGYQILYLDGVALATENFNSAAPFAEPRPVFLNDNGNALYHGLTAGVEWTW
jgi:hypothetical protein